MDEAAGADRGPGVDRLALQRRVREDREYREQAERCILSSWVVRRRHFFWTVSALVLDGVVGLGFLRFCWFGYFMSECVLR